MMAMCTACLGNHFASAHPSAPPNACLKCHGNQEPQPPAASEKNPPTLGQQFSMDWLMYEVKGEQAPPFSDISNPHKVIRGQTHYNWPERKMTEIYLDQCINIFPDGNNFSCKFISLRDKTYLMKFPLRDLRKPKSCCLWSKEPFWTPRPDVLLNMQFHKEGKLGDQKVNWWIHDMPLPGPFGYGIENGSSKPAAFWFPVIGAWVQQNFSNYSEKAPPAAVFDLPEVCRSKVNYCK